MPPSRFAVAALVLLLAGCSADTPGPAGTPERPPGTPTLIYSPGAAPAWSGDPAADDPPGAAACQRLRTAVTDASLMNPGVVAGIAQLAADADAPIADAAQRLLTAYDKAVAASGTDAEPDAVAAVSAAGAELTSVCDDSGLDTVG